MQCFLEELYLYIIFSKIETLQKIANNNNMQICIRLNAVIAVTFPIRERCQVSGVCFLIITACIICPHCL